MAKEFKIRVYAFIEKNDQLLLSYESYQGADFCKFPGGGMELGETPTQCLQRELKEELGVDAHDFALAHLCNTLVINQFNTDQQVIGIYYKTQLQAADMLHVEQHMKTAIGTGNQVLKQRRWVAKEEVMQKLTFDMDKEAFAEAYP